MHLLFLKIYNGCLSRDTSTCMFLCTITIFLQQVSAAQLLTSYQIKVTHMRESVFAYGCRSLTEAELK